MRLFLRWLAFFVVGDVLMGAAMTALWIAAALVVWPIKHASDAFSLAGWNLMLAWRVFLVQLDWDWPPFDVAVAGIVAGLIILGPIAGWILARESLDNDGWRFWRWR